MSMPFYDRTQGSIVDANENLGPRRVGLAIDTAALGSVAAYGVARSLRFHLTTVRIGPGIDLARLLLPGKRF